GELISKLKAEGVDYNERMALADEVTWPRPLADLLEPALETFAHTNPWVKNEELRPKSIVREMIETASTFTEFVSRYGIQRSEGVLLRYLTDVYRASRQIVPLDARNDELTAIIDWLGALVRSIDSSLLDEWEALADGRVTPGELMLRSDGDATEGTERAFGADANGVIAFSRNRHALRTAIRNSLFARIEALERDDLTLLDEWDSQAGWNEDRWADAIDRYFDTYDYLGIDNEARSAEFFQILEDPSLADLIAAGMDPDAGAQLLEDHASGRVWLAIQVLDDGERDFSWAIWALVDLDASDEQGSLAMQIVNFGER
ncbi:MAG: DUF3516 domain-containing protein, partial [Arcanobacterium sp.]|nr:DUF3516 domain-containing protein [Arcanobacterium sp.]